MLQEEEILKKIRSLIPDFKTFEDRIIAHAQNDHFPLIYQCLYERIMPPNQSQFSTANFKKLLHNNYLWLLNDIYRTRISEKTFDNILEGLDKVKDFNGYEVVLKQFKGCNPRENKDANAFSLGTKVLHTYNPEENPILDSKVRKELKIYYRDFNIDLCLDFKEAMNRFANEYKGYFSSFRKSNRIKDGFKKFHLKPKFPKMKILDMAILYYNENGK